MVRLLRLLRLTIFTEALKCVLGFPKPNLLRSGLSHFSGVPGLGVVRIFGWYTRRDVMKSWFSALLGVVVAILPLGALAMSVKIGNVSIELPEPEGLHDLLGEFPEMGPVAETMVVPTNRLLRLYVEPTFLVAMRNNVDRPLQRYAMAQTYRQAEYSSVALTEFQREMAPLRDNLEQTMRQLVEQRLPQELAGASQRATELFGDDVRLELGQLRDVRMFLDRPEVLGFVTIAPVNVSVGGHADPGLMASASITALVRERVLYLYVYSDYDTDGDLAWVQNTAMEWYARVAEANPARTQTGIQQTAAREPYEPRTTRSLDYDRILGKGIVGAIAGGLIALLFTVFGRK